MGPGKTHPETGVPVDMPCAVGDKVCLGDDVGDRTGGGESCSVALSVYFFFVKHVG